MAERPKGAENSAPKENRYSMDITPVIARIIDTQTEITSNGPILKFDAINKASYESRKAYYARSGEDFDTAKNKWNNRLSTWIEKNTKDIEANKELILALHSVNIDPNPPDNLKNADTMLNQVENFRQVYLGEKESDVGKFVKDIAADCLDDVHNVDLDKLSKRLHAIKPMLGIFGTDKDIHTLVAEFTVAYGHLSQKGQTVQKTLEEVEQKKNVEIQDKKAYNRLNAIGITQTTEKKQPQEGHTENKEEPEAKDIHEFLQLLTEPMPDTEEHYGPDVAIKSIKNDNKTEKEDSMVVDRNLIAVLDGVGGGEGAAAAAKAARNFIQHETKRMPEDMTLDDTQAWIAALVKRTHEHLFELKKADPTITIGQTTIGLAYNWNDTHRLWTNVGDSNVYSYEEGKLKQLSINPDIQAATRNLLVLRQLAKEQGSVDGLDFDLRKFALEHGKDFDEVIREKRRAILEETYTSEKEYEKQMGPNVTLDQSTDFGDYIDKQGLTRDAVEEVLNKDKEFLQLHAKLFPEISRIKGALHMEDMYLFTDSELHEDGKLDLQQPVQDKYFMLINEILKDSNETKTKIQTISQSLSGSEELDKETRRLQRVFNNIDSEVIDKTYYNGGHLRTFGNYRDTETDRPVSQKMANFFKTRNRISQALGASDTENNPRLLNIQVSVDKLTPGKKSATLVCTDGLDDNLTEAEIESLMQSLDLSSDTTEDMLKNITDTMIDGALTLYRTEFNNPKRTHERPKADDITAGIKVTQAKDEIVEPKSDKPQPDTANMSDDGEVVEGKLMPMKPNISQTEPADEIFDAQIIPERGTQLELPPAPEHKDALDNQKVKVGFDRKFTRAKKAALTREEYDLDPQSKRGTIVINNENLLWHILSERGKYTDQQIKQYIEDYKATPDTHDYVVRLLKEDLGKRIKYEMLIEKPEKKKEEEK